MLRTTKGRVYIGRIERQPFAVDYVLVLLDADNDAIFESVQEITYEQFELDFPYDEWIVGS